MIWQCATTVSCSVTVLTRVVWYHSRSRLLLAGVSKNISDSFVFNYRIRYLGALLGRSCHFIENSHEFVGAASNTRYHIVLVPSFRIFKSSGDIWNFDDIAKIKKKQVNGDTPTRVIDFDMSSTHNQKKHSSRWNKKLRVKDGLNRNTFPII